MTLKGISYYTKTPYYEDYEKTCYIHSRIGCFIFVYKIPKYSKRNDFRSMENAIFC